MDSMLWEPFGDLAQGHLTVLNVHSDSERSLYKHHKVDMNCGEENHNYLKEESGYFYSRIVKTHVRPLYEKVHSKALTGLEFCCFQNSLAFKEFLHLTSAVFLLLLCPLWYWGLNLGMLYY